MLGSREGACWLVIWACYYYFGKNAIDLLGRQSSSDSFSSLHKGLLKLARINVNIN